MDLYNQFDRGAKITIMLCSNKLNENRSSKNDTKREPPSVVPPKQERLQYKVLFY